MPQENTVDTSTNVEFVTDLMEFSRYGALAQVFVIEALRRYAFQVSIADPKRLDSPGLSGAAWVGVGQEIDAKLATKYGPHRTIKS